MDPDHLGCGKRAPGTALSRIILDKQYSTLAYLCDQHPPGPGGCFSISGCPIVYISDGAQRTPCTSCRVEPSPARCIDDCHSSSRRTASRLDANLLDSGD